MERSGVHVWGKDGLVSPSALGCLVLRTLACLVLLLFEFVCVCCFAKLHHKMCQF